MDNHHNDDHEDCNMLNLEQKAPSTKMSHYDPVSSNNGNSNITIDTSETVNHQQESAGDKSRQLALVSYHLADGENCKIVTNGIKPGCGHHLDDHELRRQHNYRYLEFTPIDHSWSKKILELVGNKARLMESFSWLSTVGGGFSSLGEKDRKFSMRAGALSLGQQLHLAELLGDERLKVMCHMFVTLAALQLENRKFCIRYIDRVIVPLVNKLPYRDPVLLNILRHIFFRLATLARLQHARKSANIREYEIEETKK